MKQSEVYRQNAENTRDRGCSAHPVFPAPSLLDGARFQAHLGRIAPRERRFVFVPMRESAVDLQTASNQKKA